MKHIAVALLLLCTPMCFGAESQSSIGTREAELAYSNTSVVATAPEQSSHNFQTGVGQISTPVADSSALNDWSPLLIMAAGIMGLVWVRRHVTNL